MVDVPTQDQFAALEARVAALEAGGGNVDPVPPDPGDLTPSADGAAADGPGVVLTSAKLVNYELARLNDASRNYGIAVDGVLDTATHHADKLYAEGGRIYQHERAHDTWWVSNDDGTWNQSADPTYDPGPIPDPPAVGSIVALYTAGRGPSYTWNWGTGNDEELASAIEADAAELGVFPNAYGFFPMWGGHGAWPGNLGWAVNCMISSRVGDRMRIPVVGIMPYFSDCGYGWNDDAGLRDCADGKFDDCWRGCARACKENGADTAIWRCGYENNFQFMPSAPQWNTESQQLWGRAFSRMSDVIRDESAKIGLTSVICLNWTTGAGSLPVDVMTPDASAFDWYCTDLYNNYYADGDINDEAERRAYWSSAWLGMDHVIEYAAQFGKPIMSPETGAGVRPDGHSLKDSAPFWHWESEQAASIRAKGMAWMGIMIWNIPAGDFDCRTTNGVQPNAAAALSQHLLDGSLVGDPAPTKAAVGSAAKVRPIPGYDMERAKAWVAAHPDFMAAQRARAQQVVDSGRPPNVGMRA